jgi:hypothetical protein
MSYHTTNSNNNYQADNYLADNQSRKGKFMNKHNIEEKAKEIVRFKRRKHIEPNQLISPNDIYKSTLDKKRKSILVKTRRSKGNDYKLFVANNEVSLEENYNLDDYDSKPNYNNFDYDDDDSYYVFGGECDGSSVIAIWRE